MSGTRTPGKRSGITMIEVVVGLTLMIIFSATAWPRVSRSYRQRSMIGARDRLYSAHALARSVAVRYGRVASLELDVSGNRFWVAADTGGGVSVKVSPVHAFDAADLTFTSNRARLCFDGRGLPSVRTGCDAPDAMIVFASADKLRADTARFTLLGQVQH